VSVIPRPCHHPGMTTSRPVRRSAWEGLGTPALCAGCIAVGTCWLWGGWFGIGFGVLALVVGSIGAKRAFDDPERNGGAALGGAVLGLVGLGVGAWIAVPALLGVGTFGEGLTLDECMTQAKGQQEQRMCATQHLDEYRQRFPGRQNM